MWYIFLVNQVSLCFCTTCVHICCFFFCYTRISAHWLSLYFFATQKMNPCLAQYINCIVWDKKKRKGEQAGSRGGPVMNTSCVNPSSSCSLSCSSLSSGLLLIWSPPLSTGAMIHVVPTGPHSPHTDTAQSCPSLSICPSVSACSPSFSPQASQPAIHIGPPWPGMAWV